MVEVENLYEDYNHLIFRIFSEIYLRMQNNSDRQTNDQAID